MITDADLRQAAGGADAFLAPQRAAGPEAKLVVLAGDVDGPLGRAVVAHGAAEHLALGRSNDEIARRPFISVNTVKFHLHEIYERLGVHNRVEAAVDLDAERDHRPRVPGRVGGLVAGLLRRHRPGARHAPVLGHQPARARQHRSAGPARAAGGPGHQHDDDHREDDGPRPSPARR